ncbi:uncharacterized protein [Nothobranchius furzeri]|uniref:uncharacterized protein n=1 Tax=Nothobranchius furzeri TaxID=105023 RepID=UPI003904DAC4
MGSDGDDGAPLRGSARTCNLLTHALCFLLQQRSPLPSVLRDQPPAAGTLLLPFLLQNLVLTCFQGRQTWHIIIAVILLIITAVYSTCLKDPSEEKRRQALRITEPHPEETELSGNMLTASLLRTARLTHILAPARTLGNCSDSCLKDHVVLSVGSGSILCSYFGEPHRGMVKGVIRIVVPRLDSDGSLLLLKQRSSDPVGYDLFLMTGWIKTSSGLIDVPDRHGYDSKQLGRRGKPAVVTQPLIIHPNGSDLETNGGVFPLLDSQDITSETERQDILGLATAEKVLEDFSFLTDPEQELAPPRLRDEASPHVSALRQELLRVRVFTGHRVLVTPGPGRADTNKVARSRWLPVCCGSPSAAGRPLKSFCNHPVNSPALFLYSNKEVESISSAEGAFDWDRFTHHAVRLHVWMWRIQPAPQPPRRWLIMVTPAASSNTKTTEKTITNPSRSNKAPGSRVNNPSDQWNVHLDDVTIRADSFYSGPTRQTQKHLF